MFLTLARSLAPSLSNLSLGTTARPFATTAPSVYDFLIRFHVIDRDGKRHTLKGLAGTSLAQAMHESGIFAQFDDFSFGPAIKEPDAHIYVSNEYAESLGMVSDEEKASIEQCADKIRHNSRMASYIILDKAITDLTVAQAPHLPFVIP